MVPVRPSITPNGRPTERGPKVMGDRVALVLQTLPDMVRNLSTLSILHYVYGGLMLLGGVIVAVVFFAIGGIMDSDLVQHSSDPPPAGLAAIFQGLGSAVAVFVALWGVLVILSGSWIAKRRNRTGSMIVAGFCCLSFPLGTALGIFTLVVLANDEVQRAYAGTIPGTVV